MGLFIGVGIALLIPAAWRFDLTFTGLEDGAGYWLLTALVSAVVFVLVQARGASSNHAEQWLDLALPASLGLLAIGLNLGMVIPEVHLGLDRLFYVLHEALQDKLPKRFVNLLDLDSRIILILFIFVLPAMLCYLFVKRPLRFGFGVGALFLAGSFCDLLDKDILLRKRSFFGVLHVTDRVTNNGKFRRLEHGTTLHGQQRVRWDQPTYMAGIACPLAASDLFSAASLLAVGQDTLLHPGREPQTYFHRTGPVGQVFTAYQEQLAGRHVGIIGLGSGTLASYGASNWRNGPTMVRRTSSRCWSSMPSVRTPFRST